MRHASPRQGFYYGWLIVATTFFVAFLTLAIRTGFGVSAIPMSDEFEWSRAAISLAASIAWLVNGLSQPFAGRVYDKLGGRKEILVVYALHRRHAMP